ncbi:MAG: DNA-3-methyladenine glycosylase I [Actinobacteria bacterium]|nr:DNA-3-methyladenine glycosylase I [Actinomycetota bacterium]
MSSEPPDGIVVGEDGVARCAWSGGDPGEYRRYHDTEWGYPVVDDVRLFEKLCLEGFQSGLSWLTILRKRECFRAAFAGFDFRAVAGFGAADVERLLGDAAIVRHRGKIESTINNAGRCVELVEAEGSLAAYVWQFEPAPAERPARFTWEVLRTVAQTDTSRRLARDLKRRGWTYVGPTTVYAFMQAMGLVNDHLEGCDCRAPVAVARDDLRVPGRMPV